jgi:REP element-mobilizing transposase RayT
MTKISFSSKNQYSPSQAEEALPDKCQQCHTSGITKPVSTCQACVKFKVPEGILCDLNRMGQDSQNFVCTAYKPQLKVCGADNKISRPPLTASEITDFSVSTNDSYKINLNLQKLRRDPDAVFAKLQFHIIIATKHREKFFQTDKIPSVLASFSSEEGQLDGAEIHPIHIHDDHIHFYVNSTVDLSCDDISTFIKARLEDDFHKKNPEISAQILEVSCFIETVMA